MQLFCHSIYGTSTKLIIRSLNLWANNMLLVAKPVVDNKNFTFLLLQLLQIAGLRRALDALHQELDGNAATEATAGGSIKEKLKECVDQSRIAFHTIRMERECFQIQIDELKKEKLELENKVEALEQQGILFL